MFFISIGNYYMFNMSKKREKHHTFHVTDSIFRQFNAFFLSILCSFSKLLLSGNAYNCFSAESFKGANLLFLSREVHIGLKQTFKQFKRVIKN